MLTKWLYKGELLDEHPGICEPWGGNYPVKVFVEPAKNMLLKCDFETSIRADHNNPALTEDIRKHKICRPVIVCNGLVADGHCRVFSANEADPDMLVPYLTASLDPETGIISFEPCGQRFNPGDFIL